MRAHDNLLLARMDAAIFEALEHHGSVVTLTSGEVIAEAQAELDRVYFPHRGIISCVVALAGGGVIETAMIGRDGVFGAMIALDGKHALNPAIVQVSGMATVFDARVFAEIADKHLALRRQMLAYEQFHLAEVQQTAACNAVHTVLARTCRWLLRMHDLVDGEIMITQEHLSQMMGVRRTSVTAVAKELQSDRAISLRRGRIQILDLRKIEAHACECQADVAQNYRALCGDG
jgi:CRP-like cAMP-binding protein